MTGWLGRVSDWWRDTPSDVDEVRRDLDRRVVEQWPEVVEHYQHLGNTASDRGEDAMAFRLWRVSGMFEAHRNDLEAGR